MGQLLLRLGYHKTMEVTGTCSQLSMVTSPFHLSPGSRPASQVVRDEALIALNGRSSCMFVSEESSTRKSMRTPRGFLFFMTCQLQDVTILAAVLAL